MENKVSEQQYGSYAQLCCMLKEQKHLTKLTKPETTFQAMDSITREEWIKINIWVMPVAFNNFLYTKMIFLWVG